VIDFTTPHAVVANIEACMRARTALVVGTTGWYDDLPRVRALVEQSGGALVYASNFSVGVNLFFEIARTAAAALRHHYHGQISETSWRISALRRIAVIPEPLVYTSTPVYKYDMAVTMTSIRLDTALADEAKKLLRVKTRTEAIHAALRELVALNRTKRLVNK